MTSKAPDLRPFDFKWLEKRTNVYAIITPTRPPS
jgi:hypothetical protein